MLRPPVKTSRHLDMNASSCSQQPPRGHTSMASYGPLKQSLGMLHPAANRHPKATHQWLLGGVGGTRALAHSITNTRIGIETKRRHVSEVVRSPSTIALPGQASGIPIMPAIGFIIEPRSPMCRVFRWLQCVFLDIWWLSDRPEMGKINMFDR